MLKALHEDAEASAIPEQDLAGSAVAVDEEEEVAGERVVPEGVLHEGEEAVIALAQVDGAGAGEDTDGAGDGDHESAGRRAGSCSGCKPSMRQPVGE